jgi:tight adherence protein C
MTGLLWTFVFLSLSVGVFGLLWRSRGETAEVTLDSSNLEIYGTSDGADKGTVGLLAEAARRIGERVPDNAGRDRGDSTKIRLAKAGFREPDALDVFQGARIATGGLFAVLVGLLVLLFSNANSGMLGSLVGMVAAGGFGYLLPDRILDSIIQRRRLDIHRNLPNALDLLVLSLEAGQSLDQACVETGRQLERTSQALSEEFQMIMLEMRAGKSREEALRAFGSRSGDVDLRRLSGVLLDSDRFGTNLGPTLRSQAKFQRTRMRQQSQEKARKIGVKLVFPLVLLIFPAMLLVTLGPPMCKMMASLSNGLF